MADLKLGEPFGLDPSLISLIDWELALKRISHDLRSDFIYAPHLAFVYARAGRELIEYVKSELKDGKYLPGTPLTIEVPKSHRMRVAVASKRPGPSFSRPGSILYPKDRLLYQAFADYAAPIVEEKTDKNRSFSHRLAEQDSPTMFLPTRICWNNLQKALREHSCNTKISYILKLDIANFFGSLNQHTLVNILSDSGYPKPLWSRLEVMLLTFAGDRSSRGIIQGIFPSDLFGNYYMSPVDRFLSDRGVPSARYVDDVYVFVDSVDSADRLIREFIPELRVYDLSLNESKSMVIPKSNLMTEEPDLEVLFAAAIEEISQQVSEDDFDADYGFQSEWEEDEGSENSDNSDDKEASEDLEMKATKLLFDSVSSYPGQEENIERFCLPLFSKSGSDYALHHVMDSFRKRPSMSQIYAIYLSNFLSESDVRQFLYQLLSDGQISDWQKMWVLAALIQVKPDDDAPITAALSLLRDANRHEAVRAVAAIYVGTYGDLIRRKGLSTLYGTVTQYIQAAIYYSSRRWPSIEKTNARATWGAQSPLNTLITAAMSKK